MIRRRLPEYPLTCSGHIECEVTAGDDRTDFIVLTRCGCFRLLHYDGFCGLIVVVEVKRGLVFRAETLPRRSVLLCIDDNDLLFCLIIKLTYCIQLDGTHPSNQWTGISSEFRDSALSACH